MTHYPLPKNTIRKIISAVKNSTSILQVQWDIKQDQVIDEELEINRITYSITNNEINGFYIKGNNHPTNYRVKEDNSGYNSCKKKMKLVQTN